MTVQTPTGKVNGRETRSYSSTPDTNQIWVEYYDNGRTTISPFSKKTGLPYMDKKRKEAGYKLNINDNVLPGDDEYL